MWLQKSFLRTCDWAPGSQCECCTISYILFLEPLVARNKPAERILSVFPYHLPGDSVTGYNLMEDSKRREDGLLLHPYSSGSTLRESQTLDNTSEKNFKTEGSIRKLIKIRERTFFRAWAFRQRTFLAASLVAVWLLKLCCSKDEICNKISILIQQVLKLCKNKEKQTSKKKKNPNKTKQQKTSGHTCPEEQWGGSFLKNVLLCMKWFGSFRRYFHWL